MKKAQLSITFNWIYVLIAGAVILMFFVGIVVKQKDKSEQELGTELVQTMQSIFAGAQVSEKTKNFINVGGLADYTLMFSCEDGVSKLWIEGAGSKSENSIDPVFSPTSIKAPKIITWSLPYRLPFKIQDMLMVTSSTTKYVLVGDFGFWDEFNGTSEGLNVEYALPSGNYADYWNFDPQLNFQIRIVDMDGLLVKENDQVPPHLVPLDNDKVTAVVFSSGAAPGSSGDTTDNYVTYFQKDKNKWKKLNRNPLPLISLGGERDAAKYAAIFAGNDQIYQCNMQKVAKRAQLVTELYLAKNQDIINHYVPGEASDPSAINCLGYLRDFPRDTMIFSLSNHKDIAARCVYDFHLCQDLILSGRKIKEINEQLNREDCITVY